MRPRDFVARCILTAALSPPLFTPIAAAAVPSPTLSTIPTCLDVCPAGDMPYAVVIRDFAGNPIAGSTVVIDFCASPSVYLCPPLPGDPYTISGGCKVIGVTNAAGAFVFPIRAGGVATYSVDVLADGVLMATTVSVRSPDQDGSGVVANPDFTIFASKFGSFDPTADFDCSGVVDLADQTTFANHFGHACGGITPTRPGSWGHVKQIYR